MKLLTGLTYHSLITNQSTKQFLSIFLLIFSLFQTQVSLAISPTEGLVGQWLLDENTGVSANDQSDNNINLTLNNGASWLAGLAGSALDLNGTNQDASIENATALQVPSITLSAWIYPHSSLANDSWIAAQGDNFGLFLKPDTRSVDFYIKDIQGNWSDVISVSNSIVFNQWQHVAGSFDRSSKILKVYVNGIEVGRSNFGIGIDYSTGNGFTIGSMQSERFFDGRIDEVHVYDRALSDTNIQQLASTTPDTPNNPAPVARFTATPISGDAPLNVNFDGSGSTDNGSIASYSWTFGDSNSTTNTATGVTPSHNYATAGSYTTTLTVTDNEGKTNSSNRTITVSDPSAASFLDVSISSGTDDAEQRSDGSMYLNSSDLELVIDGGIQQIGLRFNNLSIPVGSAISRAYIQFQADETNSDNSTLNIRGETSDNPLGFTPIIRNISNRPLSSASVNWSPGAWTSADVKGSAQQTEDISNIVQELIDRSGWNSGQSMVFIITGSGRRTAESFEGSADGAAILHIEYGIGDGNPAPVASFTTNPSSGDAPLNVSFDASVSTDDTGIASYK